jgi:hypothetical protein
MISEVVLIRSVDQHASSNCQKTRVDFRVVNERYGSNSNLASRVELFEIGGSDGAA